MRSAGIPIRPQRPGAEREPAGAAGRQQHVGRLLGHPDLVAEAPREAVARRRRGRRRRRRGRSRPRATAASAISAGSAPARRSRSSPRPGSATHRADDQRDEDADLDQPAASLPASELHLGGDYVSASPVVHRRTGFFIGVHRYVRPITRRIHRRARSIGHRHRGDPKRTPTFPPRHLLQSNHQRKEVVRS